jgi:hypothetical protein
MHEERNAYRVLDGKSEGKMPLGRSRQTLVLITQLLFQQNALVFYY